MTRRDSIFSTFRMGPAAQGRGLCDRVFFRVAKSRNLYGENIPIITYNLKVKSKTPSYRYISVVQGLPNFFDT